MSFSSLNQISAPIIEKSKNAKHFLTWINLGAIDNRKGLYIPIKYSKKYHGLIEDYQKGKNTSYIICFIGKRIRIILSKNGQREIAINNHEYIGVDVNIKHNLFCSKDFDIDINRKLIKDFCDFLPKYDKTKNKKNIQKYNKWLKRLNYHLKEKCSELVHTSKKYGNHLILEDLSSFGKTFIKNNDLEQKYSRLTRILNLSNLKNLIISIGNKNRISVSLVQSHYTSQQCNVCRSYW